jgi:hypothetical protein
MQQVSTRHQSFVPLARIILGSESSNEGVGNCLIMWKRMAINHSAMRSHVAMSAEYKISWRSCPSEDQLKRQGKQEVGFTGSIRDHCPGRRFTVGQIDELLAASKVIFEIFGMTETLVT